MIRRAPRVLSVAAALAALLPSTGLAAAWAATGTPLERHAVPSDGVFRLQGGGWGHGRGLSQWGAHQAATEGRTHREMLAFYYPGTSLATLTGRHIRVLLAADTGPDLVVRADPRMTVSKAGAAEVLLPATPKPCAVPATRWMARATSTGMRLDAYCGAWRAVEVVAGSSISFRVPGGLVATQNGTVRRGYWGSVAARRTGATSVQVVNRVWMETYLRSVVAAEVSPSWPVEALRAQAVAARTFAAHQALGRSKYSFDVYDGVRSQSYRGALAYDSSWRVIARREDPRTTDAVRATSGVHVTSGGLPVLTQFGASNGGVTAATPVAYMTTRVDGWDARATLNPRRAWTDSISAASLRSRYPAVGAVTALEVLSREGVGPFGGRISAMRVVGTTGSVVVRGDDRIRAALGTYSSLLTVVPPAPPAA